MREEVVQGHDGTFVFVTPPIRVDGGLRQRLLNDGLADGGSDEVRDA